MTRTARTLTTVLALWLLAGPFAQAQQIPPMNNDRRTPAVRVFAAAKDAVVNISTTRLVSTRQNFFGFDDSMFDDVFQSPFGRRNVPIQSLGSGFLIHPNGYIVTNEHVVRRAAKITIFLADTTSHPARVIATDAEHDLAILKMDPPGGKPLPALSLGRSDDLMIGETVLAIGNPKGYRHSMTTGVVSALDRELQFSRQVEYKGLIQTDASINPGNSGGPLLNVNAEVIGINTAIRPDAQGIGFAIAIDTFTADLPNLLDFQRINRVILGLEVRSDRDASGRPRLVVARVVPNSPAASQGVRPGQVLLALDGKPVATPADYYVPMIGKAAGESVQLTLAEGDLTETVAIALQARPKPDGGALAFQWLGMRLTPVTTEVAQRFRLPVGRGLLITEIQPNSPADRIGLQPRDILFQVGKTYVEDLDDIGRVLEDVRADQTFRIGIARQNVRAWTSIRTRSARR